LLHTGGLSPIGLFYYTVRQQYYISRLYGE
jgi:hypothetical protein